MTQDNIERLIELGEMSMDDFAPVLKLENDEIIGFTLSINDLAEAGFDTTDLTRRDLNLIMSNLYSYLHEAKDNYLREVMLGMGYDEVKED